VKAQCEILEDDPPDLIGEKGEPYREELFGAAPSGPVLLSSLTQNGA